MSSESTANSNLEPAPARLKIGRNSYGLWYLSATPADPLWDRFDGPAYIRADLYEAKLDEAVKREMKLRRQLAKLEAPMSTSDPLSQSTACGYFSGRKIPPGCRRWMSIEQAISTAKAVRAQAPGPTDLHKGIRMACDSIIDGLEHLLRERSGHE